MFRAGRGRPQSRGPRPASDLQPLASSACCLVSRARRLTPSPRSRSQGQSGPEQANRGQNEQVWAGQEKSWKSRQGQRPRQGERNQEEWRDVQRRAATCRAVQGIGDKSTDCGERSGERKTERSTAMNPPAQNHSAIQVRRRRTIVRCTRPSTRCIVSTKYFEGTSEISEHSCAPQA